MSVENFEALRAALNADLTQAALTGGDTAKIRAKLAQLDAREEAERQAQAKRYVAEQQQLADEATERGKELGAASMQRLQARGFDVPERSASQLGMLGRTVALKEVAIRAAEDEHIFANGKVQQIAERIQALSARADALAALRMAGQSTERDNNEAALIERDLSVLRNAYQEAQAATLAAQVPAAARKALQVVQDAFSHFEVGLMLDALRTRTKDAESAFLDNLRELMAATNASYVSQAFTCNPQLARVVSFNSL